MPLSSGHVKIQGLSAISRELTRVSFETVVFQFNTEGIFIAKIQKKNQMSQMNQMNQINQMNRMKQMKQMKQMDCSRNSTVSPTIGRTNVDR